MASCNQNCENCGPSLDFVSIGASAAISLGGAGCLNGQELTSDQLGYLNSIVASNGMSNSSYSFDAPCIYREESSQGTSNGTYTANSMTQAKVDQYGRFIVETDVTTRYNATSSSSYRDRIGSPPGVGILATHNYNDDAKSNIECKTVACNYNVCEPPACGYLVCEENCSTSYSSDFMSRSSAGSVEESDSDSSESCGAGFPGCPEYVNTCTTRTCQASDSDSFSGGGACPDTVETSSSNTQAGYKLTISNMSTKSQCKGFSKASVNKQMDIQQSNKAQNPCGTRCDSGEDKDACWIGGFAFEVVDNTNNTFYSRAKVKVVASKDDMKPYSNVQGTVYFYEGSLPGCCGEGDPIINTNFSLGSSANFSKNTQCATDVYNFDNDQMQTYAGSTIVGCIKVTKLNFK